jgi:YHS domain-containing protein
MVIEGNGVTWAVGEAQYVFCSERCRAIFSEDPTRYTRR